eukprot:gene8699-1088_t
MPPITCAMTAATRALYEGIFVGSRAALARAITLVESRNNNNFQQGQCLLARLLEHQRDLKESGEFKETVRLGISGPPGVGKSTFIESFGCHLLSMGKTLAVLTIDPTSSLTGGSILGDKTRMPRLSAHPQAFVRPSPSGGVLGQVINAQCDGGVARSTNDAIVLCESSGYDVVIVETVGVGQSEIAVADMVDLFMLMLPPAGGDELQGIKRGIMELSDLVIINKADGDLARVARQAQIEYTSALKLLRRRHRKWDPEVFAVSAVKETGLHDVWEGVERFCEAMGREEIELRRGKQYQRWMWRYVEDRLLAHFKGDQQTQHMIEELESLLLDQMITPGAAAEDLLIAYFNNHNTAPVFTPNPQPSSTISSVSNC